MKKFKWLSLVFSVFMCLSLFMLTACDLGELEGSGDNAVNSSDYIEGVTILYKPNVASTSDSFKDGITENNMTFNQLVDREISMLADDILNRLAGVYGSGYTSIVESKALNDKDNNSVTLKSANTSASYIAYNAFATYSSDDSDYVYSNGSLANSYNDLTQPESWATVVYPEGDTTEFPDPGTFVCDYSSSKAIVKNFHFKNAIIGGGFSTQKQAVTTSDGSSLYIVYSGIDETMISDRAWNWTISSSIDVSQISYVEAFRDRLRMALSSVLSGKAIETSGDYSFDQTTYNANISNIEHIGLLSYDKQVIKDLIKKVIIGDDNVTYDNEILELFNTNGVNLQNFTGFDFELSYEDLQGQTDEYKNNYSSLRTSRDKMHFYKAYDLIVDAIVEQVALNTFNNTSYKIYPEMPRLTTMFISWKTINDGISSGSGEDGEMSDIYRIVSHLGNINSIIFMPKNDMKFSSGYFLFESLTEPTDYYVNINYKFVAEGKAYTKTGQQEVKIGEFDIEKGVDNSFECDMEGAVNTANPSDIITSYENTPVWKPYDGQSVSDISTYNNPFTMTQTDTVSTLVNFNGGNNYLELSFQYYTDSVMETVYPGIPEYSFGIIGIEFEYENL